MISCIFYCKCYIVSFTSIVESNKCDLQALPMIDYSNVNDQMCFMNPTSVNDKINFINIFHENEFSSEDNKAWFINSSEWLISF